MNTEQIEMLMDAWFFLRDAKEGMVDVEAQKDIEEIMDRLHVLIDTNLEKQETAA